MKREYSYVRLYESRAARRKYRIRLVGLIILFLCIAAATLWWMGVIR
jgi:hypothetical protein